MNQGDKVTRVSNGAKGEIIGVVKPGDTTAYVRFEGGSSTSIPQSDLTLDASKGWPPAVETKSQP